MRISTGWLSDAQELLWWLSALLTPLFVNLWVEQQFEASKIWLLRTLIWLLAVLWLAAWLHGESPRRLPLPVALLSLAWLLVLGLATLLSPAPTLAFFGSLERANGFLTQASFLLLFICVATRLTPDQEPRLRQVILLTGLPITLLGLAQAAGWQPLPLIDDGRTPLITTLGRANFTGAYLALLLPLTVVAGLGGSRASRADDLSATHSSHDDARDARTDARHSPLTTQNSQLGTRHFSYFLLALLQLTVILLTQARAAWIAILVSLSLFAWLQLAPGWSIRTRRLSGFGGLGLLVAGLLLLLRWGLANGGSIAARWTIWQASLRLLWPRLWLGYGADTLELFFPSLYPPQLVYFQGRDVVVDRAHNWLLDGALSFGLVAVLLFIGLLLAVILPAWRQCDAQPWTNAYLAALGGYLAGNLFLFEVAATGVLFWLLLAMLVARSARENDFLPVSAWPRGGKMALLLGVGLVASWGIWQANLQPLRADVASWRGTQALVRGDLASAAAGYAQAASLQSFRAPYHIAYGLTVAQLGELPTAEAALLEGIALRPSDPQPRVNLAQLYAQAGQLELAFATFDEAVALAPTLARTYQVYARVALNAQAFERAAALAARAVDLDATDGASFGILGWAALELGDPAAAQPAFAEAVRWTPSADHYVGLASAYLGLGEVPAAREALAQSLAIDPAYQPALTLQVQLQAP